MNEPARMPARVCACVCLRVCACVCVRGWMIWVDDLGGWSGWMIWVDGLVCCF